MPKNTIAHNILWPTDHRVLVRACFLYVGQGSSILALVRDGDLYRLVLLDCNLDQSNGGIDVPKLLKDLSLDGHLHVFANTHPHDDHLRGIKEIAETLTVDKVWHSGHVPSRDHGHYHSDLTALMKDAEARNGADAVMELDGSRSDQPLFDAQVHVLAPAEHVKDDVNDEDAEARYRRIHENCAVLKIGKEPSWVIVTGDADLVAFRDHIGEYHRERLSAFVLDASHHGSRSFFKATEEDEPHLDALQAINPEYVVISSPTQEESQFDHPHDDAVQLYVDHVGAANVLHTGAERETFFFDIYEDGSHSGPQNDGGKLAEKYGLDKSTGNDGGGGGSESTSKSHAPFIRPSGAGEFTPRKYG
jgi:competence protein ComEC